MGTPLVGVRLTMRSVMPTMQLLRAAWWLTDDQEASVAQTLLEDAVVGCLHWPVRATCGVVGDVATVYMEGQDTCPLRAEVGRDDRRRADKGLEC